MRWIVLLLVVLAATATPDASRLVVPGDVSALAITEDAPLSLSSLSDSTAGPEGETKKKKKEPLSPGVIAGLIVADLICLCGAALFAGLTLSIMGLDTFSLEIIATSGQEPDRGYAAKLLPIRQKGNQLLCTLILGNVMVNTLIAQITDRFVTGAAGTALSTAIITLGGEIIPQATMSAHALQVGSSSAPVVNFFLLLFWPVCKPLSLFLDWAIGNDPGQIYERNEIKHLMLRHAREHRDASGLGEGDVSLMMGALDLHDTTVGDAMTPLADVFMLDVSERLAPQLLRTLHEVRHSRIPVYRGERDNIVGLLYTKDLLLADVDEATPIEALMQFYPRTFLAVHEEEKLIQMLKAFQSGKSHMAVVRHVVTTGRGDPVYKTVGVVTLDDVTRHLIRATIAEDDDPAEMRRDEEAAIPMAPAAKLGGDVVTDAAVQLLSNVEKFRAQRAGGGAGRLIKRVELSANHRRAVASFLAESVPEFAGIEADHVLAALGHAVLYEVKAPRHARGLPLGSAHNVWLYQQGRPTDVFTLVVEGCVEVIVGSGPAATAVEMESWSPLGRPALCEAGGYTPDFHARVLVDTKVLQVPAGVYRELRARSPLL